jgi:hypothetical protein
MKNHFYYLIFCTFFFPFICQAQNSKITLVDSATSQPVARAVITRASGEVITFSNDDGIFQLPTMPDSAVIGISCLGYATEGIKYDSVKNKSILTLHPIAYTLPTLFVGNYAKDLVRAAYKKADSARTVYYYGKGFDIQLFWDNNRPTECYEFLENEKIGVEGVKEREVVAARHGRDDPKDTSFDIATFRQLANMGNWYHAHNRIKQLFRDYDFEIKRIRPMGNRMIAEVAATLENHPKEASIESDFYIDTSSREVVKFEYHFFLPLLKIPFFHVSLKNLSMYFEEDFMPRQYFAPLAVSILSVKLTGVSTSGSQQKEYPIHFSETTYHGQLIPWNFNMSWHPVGKNIKDSRLFEAAKSNTWKNGLPVTLTGEEKNFLSQMEKDHAFEQATKK